VFANRFFTGDWIAELVHNSLLAFLLFCEYFNLFYYTSLMHVWLYYVYG